MAYNIADLFEHTADRVPDRPALIVGDDHLTYAELERRANQVAHRFASLDVGPGDHVGIYAYNCVPWVEAMLAAFKLRAVPININFRYVEEELAYLLDNADCVVVVYDPEFSDRLEAVKPGIPIVKHTLPIDDSWDRERDAQPAERDFGACAPDDHYMLYTGGTTGMPKGVVWRQEDVFMALGQGIDAVTGHKVESDTELADGAANGFPLVSFMLPPLMHGACQWGMLGMMFKGNTVMLTARFDAEGVWDSLEREKANAIMITGDAMARPLIETLEAHPGRWDTSSLLAVSSSAALFSAPVKDRFFAYFPNLVITDSIGSSEGGFNGIAQVPKDGTAMKGGPTVVPGPDTVVVDEELNVLTPGSEVIGKVARGGNIPLGYYKDEEKTKATFVTAKDGKRYVVAGDFAQWEADGTITLLGRGSMCINSGGEKIFPEEVESASKSHPDVFDALVVGAVDERWGQRVAAVVQARPGLTPALDDLVAHCRTKIAGYKVPRELHLVDQISRSPSGKPDYPWAQKLVAARERMNILLVVSDQERERSWLPSSVSLPWRERLLREGLEMANHWTHSSPCSPSRSTMMTGRYVPGHGVVDNCIFDHHVSLDTAIPTIGSVLRDAGWKSSYIGKWHLTVGPNPPMEAYGYSDWEGNDRHFMGWAGTGVAFDPVIASSAAAWLRSNATSATQPWFLTVGLVNPHDVMWFPMDQPEWRSTHPQALADARALLEASRWKDDETLPAYDVDYPEVVESLPANFDDDLHTKPDAHRAWRWSQQHGIWGYIDPADKRSWLRHLDYYVELQRLADDSLGVVLSALEESGAWDDTAIIFTSDHGDMCGSHGLRSKGPFIYDEIMRVPMYVRVPDVTAAGARTDALSSHVDLARTICGLAGVEADPGMDGVDLFRDTRDEVLFAHDSAHTSIVMQTRYAIRGFFDGRYKYGRYYGIGGGKPGDDPFYKRPSTKLYDVDADFDDQDHELYDLQEDPNELVNLANDPGHRAFLLACYARMKDLESRHF